MKTLLIVVALTLLVSCAPPGHDTVIVQAPAPLPAQERANGGIDGGGENGYGGRPLESYRVPDPMRLDEVQKSVSPLLANLKASFAPLAADLTFILRERNWFMIPAPLEQIPALTVGVYFPTDQMAIQNFNEVWIDARLYDKMATEDRTLLLMHEMVMGVRLLAGAGPLDRCLAKATISDLAGVAHEAYEQQRRACYASYGAAQGVLHRDVDLSKEDYGNIRALTTKLISSQGIVDGSEMRAWLTATHLRVYDGD